MSKCKRYLKKSSGTFACVWFCWIIFCSLVGIELTKKNNREIERERLKNGKCFKIKENQLVQLVCFD